MITLLPVDRNVPIPPAPPRGRHSRNQRPWRDLNVGDSFLVPDGALGAERIGAVVAGERMGKRFEVRQVAGGARVWRMR